MPTARVYGAAASVGDDAVYVLGGYVNSGISGTMFQYRPSTDEWSTHPRPMNIPRWGIGAVATNGSIYAVGGHDQNGYSAVVERYDIATNEWSIVSSMPTARAFLAVAEYNCRVSHEQIEASRPKSA